MDEAATKEAEAPAEEARTEVGEGEVQPGDFYKWYKAERARDKYLEENPVNTVEVAMGRLEGPAKTAAVLACASE